jgi:hypothetical protein
MFTSGLYVFKINSSSLQEIKRVIIQWWKVSRKLPFGLLFSTFSCFTEFCSSNKESKLW